MKLHFIKINPVGNMTIFILDQIPRKDHVYISKKLMDYSNVHAEQVGFIESSTKDKSLLRLQMMGGEFCGNAARSLAAYMAHNNYPQVKRLGKLYEVSLEVSGIDKIIHCKVEKLKKSNTYLSKIEMPLPISIKEMDIHYEENSIKIIKVDFPGIIHFIVDTNKINNKDRFYDVIKETMKDQIYDAFGIMYYNYSDKFMEPLVYVKATDSLFWESSCASGTSALGCALSFADKKSINEDVFQPGGSLRIIVNYDNENINSLYLNGDVKIVSEGIAYI